MTGHRIGAALMSLVISASVCAQEAPHWSYSGDENGPAKWADLTGYKTCKTGTEQSPINIVNPGPDQDMPKLTSYFFSGSYPGPLVMRNNGHTIQLLFYARCPGCSPGPEPQSTARFDGVDYDLRELHFHAPSEHQINGIPSPLEMHLVHQEFTDRLTYTDGRRLVIAVLFSEGEVHGTLDRLLRRLPTTSGGEVRDSEGFGYLSLLPTPDVDLRFNMASYRYRGSLTTPPCTQGVTWIVLSNKVSASRDQLNRMAEVLKSNARPVQGLNGRAISPP